MVCLSDYLEIERLYSQAIKKDCTRLVISAANTQEGTSSVAFSVATRFAKAGKKTLLVDMNYFRPSLHKHFSIQRNNWRMLDDTVEASVQQVAEYLYVLPASLTLDVNLRQSSQLNDLLSQWDEQYDAVIFDTSPFNAINRHNLPAEQICSLANGIILVMHSGVTKEGDILVALSKLESHRAKILGWVMNDLDCPTLPSELRRKLIELERYMPRLARRLDKLIMRSDLINQVI